MTNPPLPNPGPSSAATIDQRTLMNIIEKIRNIEQAIAPPPQEDTEDPKFYPFINAENNVAFDPDDLKEINDLDKLIPTFAGDASELYQFLNITGKLVYRYTPTNANDRVKSNQLHTLCMLIRGKIKGEANSALVNNLVSLNYNSIKRTLTTYFGEKRDLTTLDQLLMNCSQNHRMLEDFYDDINRFMSHIANNIQTDSTYSHPEAAKAMITHFNNKALDSFIRGLDGDTGKFVRCSQPQSLASAYAYCLGIQNADFRQQNIRKTYENTNNPRNAIPIKHPPKIPMKPQNRLPQTFLSPQFYTPKYYPNFQALPPIVPPRQPNFQHYYPRPQFQPNLQQNSQQYLQPQVQRPFYQQGHQNPQLYNNSFQNKQNFTPKFTMNQQQRPQFTRNPFQPKPEPMDVDNSIRSRQVNYQNRPDNQNGPNKRPRIYNIENQQEQEIQEEQLPSEEEYLSEYDIVELNDLNEEENDHAEFNFLA